MTHAFFKAGLVLGAGSVMHAMGGEGDITKMGGLGKHMPVTRWTFFVYCLAIAGIFPFAGFFSKDAILAGAFASHFEMAQTMSPMQHKLVELYPKVLWAVLALAAMCTAFYMWRLYFVVFTGKFRGTPEQEHHLHESPSEMTLPLVVLAVGAVLVGLIGVPAVMLHGVPEPVEHALSFFSSWLVPSVLPASPEPHEHAVEWGLMAFALVISLAGIGLAARLYRGGISETAVRLKSSLLPVYNVLWNKYYVDEFYDLVIVRPLRAVANFLWQIADAIIIDGGLTKVGPALVSFAGGITRRIQNGDVQRYLVAVVVGSAGVLFLSTYWLPYAGVQGEITQEGRKVTLDLGRGRVPEGRLVYRIDWDGDGKFDVVNTRFTKGHVHEYQNPGTYKIVVEARDPQWGVVKSSDDFFGARQKLSVKVE
jgi:NADH-quinone oxidoreductase subunit L